MYRPRQSEQASVLIANQSARIAAGEVDVFPTQDKNYLAWKTGVFHFERTPIDQVVRDLNSYYDHKITLSDSTSTCLFSSSFQQQGLKEIMEIIQLSCGLKLKQKHENYELY